MNYIKIAVQFFVLLFICYSCARNPYAATNRVYKQQAREYAAIISQAPLKDTFATSSTWVGAVNFNMRKPNFVILHHTAQNSCAQTLTTFTLERTQVSAHYVICKDGTVYHMLNDYLRAWHAGAGKWGNVTDINSVSIGIELDNNGFDPFDEAQIQQLLRLLDHLKRTYNIPAANFIGHLDIAPARKVDPSIHFPWKRLAENGFGLWYDDTTNVRVPENFSQLQALRVIGYNVQDSSAAMRAFKQHFLSDTTRAPLTEGGRRALFNLSGKY